MQPDTILSPSLFAVPGKRKNAKKGHYRKMNAKRQRLNQIARKSRKWGVK